MLQSPVMVTWHRVLTAIVLAAGCLTGTVASWAGDKSPPDETAELAERFRVWLEETELLISEEERQAFLALAEDYQRDAFIERFWRWRDPYPETITNEGRRSWTERLEASQRLFDQKDERRTVYLLNGEPAWRCRYLKVPDELWYYPASDLVGREFFVLFRERYIDGPLVVVSPDRSVNPGDAFGGRPTRLPEDLSWVCKEHHFFKYRVWLQNQDGFSLSRLYHEIVTPPEPPNPEWISEFLATSTTVAADAERFDASVEVRYPGRHQSRTVVQTVVTVAPADAAGSRGFFNFLVRGEVLREDKLFEHFRYRFDLPAGDGEAEAAEVSGQPNVLPLIFQRPLRPGEYTLLLKVEDLNAVRFFHHRRPLTVPAVTEMAELDAAIGFEEDSVARIFAEVEAAVAADRPLIRIIPPRTEILAGLQRFATLVTGRGISEVTFLLDGQPIMTKRRPPFEVELDLGELPQAKVLAVDAYGDGNDIVAHDEFLLNPGGQSFRVRLVEPRRGDRYERSLLARAEVETPDEVEPQRVEFFVNETRVATVFQPPFAQPMVLPPTEQIAYVRAVAYLADGHSTEDLVFVNTPELIEEIDVQMVELYASVLDRERQPVLELGQQDFVVAENGVEQTVRRFEPVGNLPVQVALMIDVSGSMEDGMATARQAAMQFLEQALTPRDRAALIAFDRRPRLEVGLTADQDLLSNALLGLRAAGGTALYDSLIFTLYYLTGIRGQRAVLLLSDGADEDSDFDDQEALEYVRRAGVTVYTVGLKLPSSSRRTRKLLAEVARESGGRSFFLDNVEELGNVYGTIERELRSRYLLAYQSSNTGDGFREVEVQVLRDGKKDRRLTVTALRGYYP